MTTPTQTGHYLAKWKIADDGTREGDELTPSDVWEVVQVNDSPNDPDLFRVSVPGVERSQSLDNFFWGPGPLEMPK